MPLPRAAGGEARLVEAARVCGGELAGAAAANRGGGADRQRARPRPRHRPGQDARRGDYRALAGCGQVAGLGVHRGGRHKVFVANLVRGRPDAVEGQPQLRDAAVGRQGGQGEDVAHHRHRPPRGTWHRLPRGRPRRGRARRPPLDAHHRAHVRARVEAVLGAHRQARSERSVLLGPLRGRLQLVGCEMAGPCAEDGGAGHRGWHSQVERVGPQGAHKGLRRALQRRLADE
mmetsp:Transcript_48698/g.140034  ORF Transcript_48698/g.140034 Transcript_48698/m.140034 type:complete len:231 (+) Transcript_48698:598-1290(+)